MASETSPHFCLTVSYLQLSMCDMGEDLRIPLLRRSSTLRRPIVHFHHSASKLLQQAE